MTHATLSKWLKQMEAGRLAARIDYGEIPPRVGYALTELGRDFALVLEQVQIWGQKCIAEVEG